MSLFSTFGQEVLRLTLPYGFAALGGVICERAGVVNIALEAALVAAAWSTAWGGLVAQSALLAAVAGIPSGALTGALLCILVERLRVSAILAGLALNLAALGGSRVLLRAAYGSTANSPTMHVGGAPTLALAMLLIGLLIVTELGFVRTRPGLLVRAAGEDAERARMVGVPVFRVRLFAAMLGTAVAGLGGVALVLDQRQFQAQMTAGRGFVALAAVTLGARKPRYALGSALLFGGVEALSVILQARTAFSAELLNALPYVITLAVLLFVPLVLKRAHRPAQRPNAQ